MISRGSTLATGSLHIVDLASVDAAREFVEHEPYNRAGLFGDQVIRRFRNLLGRTMWDSPQDSVEPRFFVIVHLRSEDGKPAPVGLPAGFTALPHERLIVHGELFTPEEARAAGVALALQAPTRDTVDELLRDRLAVLDCRFDVEVLDWEFGRRR